MQDLTKLVVYSAHTTATVNRIPKVTVSQHQILSSKQSKLRAKSNKLREVQFILYQHDCALCRKLPLTVIAFGIFGAGVAFSIISIYPAMYEIAM